ncbi:hypothetical protein [Pseudomonas amygdali]|uniref:Uncharacterized protein n=2 Tax=Pseudomonas amygdali pv. lachrymans TaxID=53707 RepID=A0ABR5KRJ6_PSEAV|nr:hypothetical protein [Pseudomonas amygdali]AXH59980.1 hypothetical protein PLA107_032660 [Pseudomonas amygdali pv. lachrymans str. M301315]KPC17383.1 Uncharacterized protein AC499_0585 [Pseudomonas amygdali pv. lachrymans]RMT06461.1 hypothetical protein ALP54_03837 [Pseudomonas amygdali pv. lachrymans]
MKYLQPEQKISREMEQFLLELGDEIMPLPPVTGEEKNWNCVPVKKFERYLPYLESMLNDAYSVGREEYDLTADLLWGWISTNTYHMIDPEIWIRRAAQVSYPPLGFFLKNIRYFSNGDAFRYTKGALNCDPSQIKINAEKITANALRWHRYGAAQEALDAWRLATFNNQNWQRDYAKLVFGSIEDGMDYTSVMPGTGLKSFLEHNQADLLHCINMNRYGLRGLAPANIRYLSALKGGKLDDLLTSYGEYTFLEERNPPEKFYSDLADLGIAITRSQLLSHMQYSSSGSQWFESFRLLMMRGEQIELHDVCVPNLTGTKPKPWGATSVPGPTVTMKQFIELLTELCEKGDSPRAAAIHYIGELVQTDDQMPNRLLDAGLPRDFLEVEVVREKNFMMDLGL